MPKLTDADIAEAKRLCEAATPGPWLVEELPGYLGKGIDLVVAMPFDDGRPGWVGANVFRRSDADFITAARDLLPRAVAELEALREFRRRVAYQHSHEGDLKALDEAIGELLAEHDRG